MKRCLTVALFICWPLIQALAQTKVAATLDRGDYFFIPESALAHSVGGIIYQDKTLRKVPVNNRPIKLYWSSICNDGYYELTITPEQIFFSSGHDNPNPNYLFWVIRIDRQRYESIRKGLLENLPNNFLDLSKITRAPELFKDESATSYKDKFNGLSSIPAGWPDAKFGIYCKDQVRQRLDTYFSLLNSYISNSQKKLVYPKSDSPKLFSYSKEDIKDWLPIKTKH